MEVDYLKIVITLILAVLGWLVAHYFTAKRGSINKRREMSIEHLVDAYRVLAHDISRRELTSERQEKLENLLSDIQLFGSTEQVELAKQLADQVAAGGEFQLDILINSLRNDLRAQLNLSRIEGNVKWLRFNR
jgi:hypothetical protein